MEKKYTEKDLILAKREGYKDHMRLIAVDSYRNDELVRSIAAAAKYPLPMKIIIREEPDPDPTLSVIKWRVINKYLQFKESDNWYTPSSKWFVERDYMIERFALWADLAKNPTKEVYNE